jgi:hypothetical protein
MLTEATRRATISIPDGTFVARRNPRSNPMANREARFPIGKGVALISYPEDMTPEDVDYFEKWLALIIEVLRLPQPKENPDGPQA